MVARGYVRNGVVVLDDGAHFPEGQEVTVLTHLPDRSPAHRLLDIPSVSLGSLRHPLKVDDDLLGEMLEGRS